jgi:FkbM family methyltransferase
MTFVDVGANWGYFTLLGAHQVAPGGRVVCLEPDPRLFAMLAANVKYNGLARVEAVQAAAAASEGTLLLAGYDEQSDNWGVSRITRAAAAPPVSFAVAARPLDRILDELGLGAVNLLKMDIEGAEGFALAGLARSLAAHRIERLLLEVHPAQLAEHGRSAAALADDLRAAGYRGWTVDHSPAATRQATYQRRLDVARLLRPFDPAASLDDWPHLLWVIPGLAMLP